MQELFRPPNLIEVELKRASEQAEDPFISEKAWWHKYESGSQLISGQAYRILKRVMDLFITLLILPVFLLIFIALAIAIKLGTPGPIIFRQLRTGKDGRRFHMYKFRTMVANAEEQKKELADLNDLGELDGPLKLGLNDPRITRVGRFLRKTSLDELPQMFNIIKGDMSWVGPRPTSWGLTSYELWHTERLDTLPGITGLWQLCGRGDTEFEHWVRWDIAYVRRQSLAFDLEILLRTFLHVVKQRGAH